MTDSVMPVYRRSDITMVRGDGCYLYDEQDKPYLDFATGIAVNALGHSHPHVVEAIKTQADILWHCSNMYWHPQLKRFADRLTRISGMDKVFFGSSGAEAVECALKVIRKFHDGNGQPERYRIITFEGGFHGRTFGGISAGGNALARAGYAPLLDGFDRVAFNDIGAVKAVITPQTAGILIEAIQGEGGIRVAGDRFLQELRKLCDTNGLLLFCDEVQCGYGRSGAFFGFNHSGIKPDIVTVAKGIGNGFPLSACLATNYASQYMTPGSHGSTYGGNALAMAVGNAVLDIVEQQDFLPHVLTAGEELKEELEALAKTYPQLIEEVRGRGLMLGLKMRISPSDFATTLRAQGLLTAPAAGDHAIRILPPLIINETHIKQAISILSTVCANWSKA